MLEKDTQPLSSWTLLSPLRFYVSSDEIVRKDVRYFLVSLMRQKIVTSTATNKMYKSKGQNQHPVWHYGISRTLFQVPSSAELFSRLYHQLCITDHSFIVVAELNETQLIWPLEASNCGGESTADKTDLWVISVYKAFWKVRAPGFWQRFHKFNYPEILTSILKDWQLILYYIRFLIINGAKQLRKVSHYLSFLSW